MEHVDVFGIKMKLLLNQGSAVYHFKNHIYLYCDHQFLIGVKESGGILLK